MRVAASLCRIVQRELVLGPTQSRRVAERLAALLGEANVEAEASELAARVRERLRAGDDAEFEATAHGVLLELVRGKLAVAKPGYDAYGYERELEE